MTNRMSIQHSAYCLEHSSQAVREECADQLTAQWFDHDAVERDAEFVAYWAEEWLECGNSTCRCSEVREYTEGGQVMRVYVQCPIDGQREFFDRPVRDSVVFCGFCGTLLPVNDATMHLSD